MPEPLRRIFDLAVAATALVLTAPALGAALLAIRLESPGHPIYRQRRVGKDGAPFDVLKLRTMVSGAERMGAALPWPERIELDLWYVEHRSTRLDLKIMWLTVRMLVSGHGLYRGETGGW